MVELTKEIAEYIFFAGGDWRMTCKNLTDGIIDKAKWAEGKDFEDIWNEIPKQF